MTSDISPQGTRARPRAASRARSTADRRRRDRLRPAVRAPAATRVDRRAHRGDGRRAVGALTTTWLRSRPRSRNSGAGPSTSRPRAAPGPPRWRRGRRIAAALATAPRWSRRPGSASRTAGSAGRGGARARRRGSRRCRAGRRGRSTAASGSRVWTSTRPRTGAAPCAARELGDQRERALLRAEVREAQRGVGVDARRRGRRRGSRGPWRRPACRRGSPARPRPNACSDRPPGSPMSASRRSTGRECLARSCSRRSVPVPWRASDTDRHSGQRSGTCSRWPQWWQDIAPSARCRTSVDVAVRALPGAPARAAGQEVRPAAAVEQDDGLAARRRSASCVRRCSTVPAAVARMSMISTGGSGRAVDARRGSRIRRRRVQRLGPRRRAADHEHAAGRRRAALGDEARVVARVALVLVGRVVLLVDDDESDVLRAGRTRRCAGRRRRGPRPSRSRRHSS